MKHQPQASQICSRFREQDVHWWTIRGQFALIIFTTKTSAHTSSIWQQLFNQVQILLVKAFLGNQTHDLSVTRMFEPQEHQKSLETSYAISLKTIHTLSPWRRHKQTNGPVQTGANT